MIAVLRVAPATLATVRKDKASSPLRGSIPAARVPSIRPVLDLLLQAPAVHVPVSVVRVPAALAVRVLAEALVLLVAEA